MLCDLFTRDNYIDLLGYKLAIMYAIITQSN